MSAIVSSDGASRAGRGGSGGILAGGGREREEERMSLHVKRAVREEEMEAVARESDRSDREAKNRSEGGEGEGGCEVEEGGGGAGRGRGVETGARSREEQVSTICEREVRDSNSSEYRPEITSDSSSCFAWCCSAVWATSSCSSS